MAALNDFSSAPSEELLCQLTKEQLLNLASHYDIEIASSDKHLKDSIRDALKTILTEKKVLKPSSSPAYQQLVKPQMSEREIELRLKELAFQELQLEDTQKESLLREKQMHLEHECFLKELELKYAALSSSTAASSQFDVMRNIGLVPPFAEKNVEKYFPHFDCVATVSKWPTHAWTLLLQSVLVEKAQEAYSALSIEDSKDYVKVKDAILRTYELIPEAYRQCFRSLSKLEEQTYVDFAKEKENIFNIWCSRRKQKLRKILKN